MAGQNAGEVRVKLALDVDDLKNQLGNAKETLKGTTVDVQTRLLVTAESAKNLQKDFDDLKQKVDVPVNLVWPQGGPQMPPGPGGPGGPPVRGGPPPATGPPGGYTQGPNGILIPNQQRGTVRNEPPGGRLITKPTQTQPVSGAGPASATVSSIGAVAAGVAAGQALAPQPVQTGPVTGTFAWDPGAGPAGPLVRGGLGMAAGQPAGFIAARPQFETGRGMRRLTLGFAAEYPHLAANSPIGVASQMPRQIGAGGQFLPQPARGARIAGGIPQGRREVYIHEGEAYRVPRDYDPEASLQRLNVGTEPGQGVRGTRGFGTPYTEATPAQVAARESRIDAQNTMAEEQARIDLAMSGVDTTGKPRGQSFISYRNEVRSKEQQASAIRNAIGSEEYFEAFAAWSEGQKGPLYEQDPAMAELLESGGVDATAVGRAMVHHYGDQFMEIDSPARGKRAKRRTKALRKQQRSDRGALGTSPEGETTAGSVEPLLASGAGAIGPTERGLDAASVEEIALAARDEVARETRAQVRAELKDEGLTGQDLSRAVTERMREVRNDKTSDLFAAYEAVASAKEAYKANVQKNADRANRAGTVTGRSSVDREALIPPEERARGGMLPPSLDDISKIAAIGGKITTVGEHGTEALVDLPGGGQFVVPNHQLDAFMDRRHHGGRHVQGRYRDRGGRWQWGPESDQRGFAPAPILPSGPAGLRIMDAGGGTFEARRARADMSGLAAGTSATLSTASNDIQRVLVTNWPEGLQNLRNLTDPASALSPDAERRARAQANAEQARSTAEENIASPSSAGPRRATSRVRASEAEKQRGREMGRRAQDMLGPDPIAELRAGISEELSLVPVRALSVSVGQQFQQLFGGRAEIQGRARLAAQKVDVAATSQTNLRNLQSQRAIIQDQVNNFNRLPSVQRMDQGQRQEEFDRLNDALGDLTIAVESAEEEFEFRLGEAQTAREGIATPGQRLRATGVGVVGIVGGTLLFTAAMKAAQVGVAAFSEGMSNATDRVLGFEMTAKQVTDALSQSLRTAQFTPGGAFAGAVAQTGISGAVNLAGLQQYAQLQANNQNLQEQINLIRAERRVSGRDPLTQPTGGLFGTQFFATPSTGEQIAGLFGPSVTEDFLGLLGGVILGPELGGVNALEESRHSGKSPLDFVTGELQDAAHIFFGGDPGKHFAEIYGTPRNREEAAQSVDFLNKQIRKAGEGFGSFIALTDEMSDPRTREALIGAGVEPEQAARIANQARIAGLTGNAAEDVETARRALQGVSLGGQRPDRDLLMRAMLPQLRAQAMATQAVGAFQRNTVMPADFSMRMLADPLSLNALTGILPGSNAGFGASRFGSFGGVGGALSPEVMAQLEASRTRVGAQAGAGRQALIDLGLTDEDIKDVEDLGREIKDLQDTAQDLQLAHEATLFNRQLFISKRTVGDMIGVMGDLSTEVNGQVIQATELGQLQRQQIMDNREISRIQLARTQREINLRLALSRLQAPGETPEERAVRRREAELIAREDQRIFNLQERQTQRGFRIEDIGIERNAEEAIFALQQLQEQRQLTIDVRGISAVTDNLGLLRNFVVQSKNSITSVGATLQEQAITTLAQIQGQANDFRGVFVEETRLLFEAIRDGSRMAFPKDGGFSGATSDTNRSASGTIGLTTGTMSFMAGEAGTEGVLVIRNPRVGTGAVGGGGRTTVNINMGNVSVRDDSDIDKLADRVVEKLHQEAAIVGAF